MNGCWITLPLDKVRELQAQLGAWLNEHAPEPMRQINTTGELEAGHARGVGGSNRSIEATA